MWNGRLRDLPLSLLLSHFFFLSTPLHRVLSLVCPELTLASPRSPCLPTIANHATLGNYVHEKEITLLDYNIGMASVDSTVVVRFS